MDPNTDTWSLADARSTFKPQTAEARVCFDGELVAEVERLEAELEAVVEADKFENRTPVAPRMARRIVELHGDIRAAERTFKFVSIGGEAWSDLLGEHPPTKEQRADGYDHDPATFPYAAIAASCAVPSLEVDDVHWLEQNLALGQYQRLWRACLAANVGNRGVGKEPSAIATVLASGLSSTTAHPEESPEAASSAAA